MILVTMNVSEQGDVVAVYQQMNPKLEVHVVVDKNNKVIVASTCRDVGKVEKAVKVIVDRIAGASAALDIYVKGTFY